MKHPIITSLGLAVLASISLVNPAQAALSISVTGNAKTTTLGYNENQSYTFNWVINDDYTGSVAYDKFVPDDLNRWYVEVTSNSRLWSSVSGDGLVGTYSRPSGSNWAPFDLLENDKSVSTTSIKLLAGNDDPLTSSMGLTANGTEVSLVESNLLIGAKFAFAGVFTNPAEFFADYVGTYSLPGYNGIANYIRIYDISYNSVDFAPTSVAISMSAVPEVTSSFTMLGLISSGLLLRRRTQKIRTLNVEH
ncbi:MAG: hypothetical protein WCH43_16675 [Verrucomicrobiota bacterium]